MVKENSTQRSSIYPLTMLQQGMLFHSLASPQQAIYVQQFLCDLKERLEISSFVRAWEQLVERHAILRTSFAWEGRETPVQIVHPSVKVQLTHLDWRDSSVSEQAIMREEYLQADRRNGIQFLEAPLFRLALIRLNEVHYQLLWTSHHAVLDGRSRFILLEELFEIYEASIDGRAPRLSPPVDFRVFLDWLQAQNAEASGPFWRELLAGYDLPTFLSGGIQRLNGPKQTDAVASRGQHLSAAFSDSLRTLASEHGLTLNTLFQGAWAILLSRYCGKQKVFFGAVRAGRGPQQRQVRQAVGLLINTVAMPVDVNPDAQVLAWLKQLNALWVLMRPHEHIPLNMIQKWSQVTPGTSLFDSLVVFENYQLTPKLQERGDRWRHRTFSLRSQSNYPLVVNVNDGREIALKLEYDPAHFSPDFVERMVGHFVTLLDGIVADAKRRLSELPLLTEAERHQLLVEWNDTAADYPQDRCVHELFEEQVQRTPDAVAVVFEEEALTYRELNAQANQLAYHLIGLGVGPETLVGLCVDRSLELVVGILGILKAGGAYVPLDADYPQQRLEFMVTDAKVHFCVTKSALLDRLPATRCQFICLDTEVAKLKASPNSNLSVAIAPDMLVYVIYTSGSTGIPKGVAMPHTPLVNLIDWHRRDPRLSLPARTLQFASCNFDVSFQELMTTWCSGGTLFLVSEETRRDPGLLWKLIAESRIERVFMPYIALQQLARSANRATRGVTSSLRDIVSAGEALQLTHEIRQMLRNTHDCRLLNHYGPTESHVVTTLLLEGDPADWPIEAPIGRSISNTQIYVLDKHCQPVPIGIPGELYIGGVGLARGYLNRPELTAEKFVANPFADDEGSRLYRTGDLCRWRADGNLDFLGRIDDQVKLRGFRIELGEIEAVINENPDVAQSVIALREDRPGDKRLVAYCVASSDSELNYTELRTHLQQRLPDYMVPSAFVRLNRLPLTPSGKINRRALPAPDDSRPELESKYVAPRDPLEAQLASIWCELLRVERVGVHDNFFALGGHSLLVARMVGSIDRHKRPQISIASVFRNPTIAELARCLTHDVNTESTALANESRFLRVLRKGKGTGTVVCLGVPNGQLMMQLTQDVTVLQLNTEPHLQWGIEQFVDAFALEVERAVASGPILIVGYSYGGLIAFALARRLRQRVGKSVELVMIEPSVPSQKHKLVLKPAESRKERFIRHFGNLRACGVKGWSKYLMEKVSFKVRGYQERWELGLIRWKVKLNLPLKTGQKSKHNGSIYLRNIRKHSVENLQGNAHVLGSAQYLNKHQDFWRSAVEGECRTRLLKNNSHHLDILDPAKSDEWIRYLAELACKSPA